MEEVRKVEGLSVEELKAEKVELLPDREEMVRRNFNVALAFAQQGAQAQANQGVFINY
jgi:hypothetical protein